MKKDKENTLEDLVNHLSLSIEDDAEFMEVEYNQVRDYCEQKEFKLSEDDLSTLRSIGLESWLEDWEEHWNQEKNK